MSLNLIETAIQKTKEAHKMLIGEGNVINKPSFPKAFHSYYYLTLREAINVGCREAVKLLLNPYKRSIAYSILVKALHYIFISEKNPQLIAYYNSLLEQLIGST